MIIVGLFCAYSHTTLLLITQQSQHNYTIITRSHNPDIIITQYSQDNHMIIT